MLQILNGLWYNNTSLRCYKNYFMSHVSPSSPFILWNAMSPSVEKGIKRPNQRALYIIANIAFPFMLFLADVVVTLASKCCFKTKEVTGQNFVEVTAGESQGPYVEYDRSEGGGGGELSEQAVVAIKAFKTAQAEGLADLKRLLAEEKYKEFLDSLILLMDYVEKQREEELASYPISDDLEDFLSSVVFNGFLSDIDKCFCVKLLKAQKFDLFVRLYKHRYHSKTSSIYKTAYKIKDEIFKYGLFAIPTREILREVVKHEGMREIINEVCFKEEVPQDKDYKVMVDGKVYDINRGVFYRACSNKRNFLEMRVDYLQSLEANKEKTKAQLEEAERAEIIARKEFFTWYEDE